MQIKPFYIILILSILVFSANIGGLSIYILDEAKNATCAREMLERGDVIVPTFNQQLRTDKPPLHYFFMMLAYSIFGINEFAARFFSAICGILTVLMTFRFTRQHLGEKVAFFTGIAMVTSLQIALQFHLATPDPYLIFLLGLCFFSFFNAYTLNSKNYLLLFYVAAALAVLTKGPVSVVIPAGVVFFFLIFKKDFKFKSILKLLPWQGILLFIAITLPWYLLVHFKTNGEWTYGFFFEHNFSRYTKTMEGHGGPIFLIPLFMFTGLLPSSLFIVQAIGKAWRERHQDLILYSLTVLGVIMVFFSISRTKLPSYPAPSFPFIAIILGYFLSQIDLKESIKKYKLVYNFVIYLLIGLAFPIGIYIAIGDDRSINQLTHLSYYFILISIGAIAGLVLFFQGKATWGYYAWAASFFITAMLFFYIIFPQVDRENPVSQSLQMVSNESNFVSYRRYNPAFSFYIRKPIESVPDATSLQSYLERNPDTYVLTNSKDLAPLDSLTNLQQLYKQWDLFEKRHTLVHKMDK